MEGPVIRFKFQTENTADLCNLQTFVNNSIHNKYIGKSFKGNYILDVAHIDHPDTYIVENMLVLNKCYMQVEGSFIPLVFNLIKGSILLGCLVSELKEQNQVPIMTFKGRTKTGHNFECKILSEDNPANNAINDKVNVVVKNVFYYPGLETINITGMILTDLMPGIFSTFDIKKISVINSKDNFNKLHSSLSRLTEDQKNEIEKRAKSIFVDVDNYYKPIKDHEKVVIKSTGSMIEVSPKDSSLEKGAGKSQIVYVDLANPLDLNLYVIRPWDADASVTELGAEVEDKDTAIGTEEVFSYYINWVASIIENVYPHI